MDLFALDDDLAKLQSKLEARLAGSVPFDAQAHAAALTELSWHLRQRDCARALTLADDAHARMAGAALAPAERTRMQARLTLVRAEVMALMADLTGGQQLALAALDLFDSIADASGCGDCHWLLTNIWRDSGESARGDLSLARAAENYAAAGDAVRVAVVRARSLSQMAFSNSAGAIRELEIALPATIAWHESVGAWIAVTRANAASLTDDPGAAIKHDLQAHHSALATGQVRQALICAVNLAEGFATLGDLSAAMEWSENALSMARDAKWPGTIGACLMQAGDVLRMLARHDEARAFLLEALALMSALKGSRNHDLVLLNLGQLALDVGNFDEALERFVELGNSTSEEGEADILIKAQCGHATALSRLKRPHESLVHANAALELARTKGNADGQIRVLQLFAELHRDHPLEPPAQMNAPSARLHYLYEALAIAKSMAGYAVPPDLYNHISMAHAALQDYKAAFEQGLVAHQSRTALRGAEAQKRALAMQIRNETRKAREDIERHEQLAATLQQAVATLETLGQIGREITASLDASAVFEALMRHVSSLLAADSFVIYLLDAASEQLSAEFAVEDGQHLPSFTVKLNSPTSMAARCARERREIVIDRLSSQYELNTVPGTRPTLSMLFAPLEVGNRALGVMTIQSRKAHAYGERECAIFRTLCAYGAIALDNASAYHAVESARRKAAEQEQELRVAAAAFESQQGMFIADGQQRIARVNSAFTAITGFAAHEVLGRGPGMFKTARHTAAFYAAIEDAVNADGHWQGEVWTRRKNGEIYPMWLGITAVRTDEGLITNHVYSLVDITERKQAEEEIRHLAFYDPLTNLPNRRLLMDRLRQAVLTSARNGAAGALLFIDLDNFKKLNDTLGHDVGDLLLEQVAQRLCGCVRAVDTVARLGGDEFVILLEALDSTAEGAAPHVEALSAKILAALNQPYQLGKADHHSTPSIGVCLFSGADVPIDELVKQADMAMYQAKAAGRNAVRFFDPAMQTAVLAHAALEADMRQGLSGDQFLLYYQPQVDASGRVIGAEALVRWKHPVRGMVSPGEFIPLAEETGLILALGAWVLETGCTQLRQWQLVPESAHLSLAVNISARQFHDPGFTSQVLATLERTGADPRFLKLELTESLLVHDVDSVIAKMNTLIPKGVRFSLDDFGTGYSSLSYLKRLPLEQLKIDQSFVRDIFLDANDLAIVRAIVTLGDSLGLSVIAEGVETDEQRRFLHDTGCTTYQGYLFGRPVPAQDFRLTP